MRAEAYSASFVPFEDEIFALDFVVAPTRSCVYSSAYADASEHIHHRHRVPLSPRIDHDVVQWLPHQRILDLKNGFLCREHGHLTAKEIFDKRGLQNLPIPARPVEEIDIQYFAQDRSLDCDRAQLHHALGEPDRAVPSTFDHIEEPQADGHQLIYDQRGLATQCLIRQQDTESLSQQTSGHSRNAHRVTVCHALIGTSIVGIATSLSLALWWSIAHGDPGSGFTIGSYVLAVFGVLVGIPGYRHSKNCQCWESKPKGA